MSELAIITIQTTFISEQSDPKLNRFVFSYTITIKNTSENAFQLISRHWIISDTNNKVEEVKGEGVIGKQPIIKPKESFTYSSGAILDTEVGTMEGKYFMVSKKDNSKFTISIPKFTLSIPRILH